MNDSQCIYHRAHLLLFLFVLPPPTPRLFKKSAGSLKASVAHASHVWIRDVHNASSSTCCSDNAEVAWSREYACCCKLCLAPRARLLSLRCGCRIFAAVVSGCQWPPPATTNLYGTVKIESNYQTVSSLTRSSMGQRKAQGLPYMHVYV